MDKNLKIKVFITGVNSEFIRQLVQKMNPEIYAIFGLSRKKIVIPNVTIIEGDLLDPTPWIEEIKNTKILLHAAAITHSYNTENYFRINTQATKDLIDLSLKYNVRKFVLISSRTAGLASGAYGTSKFLAEEYLKKQALPYLIIRPSEIFGGQKGEGIDQLIQQARIKKVIACPIQVTEKLWPIYLQDIVNLLSKLLFTDHTENSTIILNGPKPFSVYEIIKLSASSANNNIFILPIPKFVMLLAKFISETFKLKFGPKPDQISRLYSKKETQTIDYPFMLLETYLSALNSNSSQ